MEQVNPGEMILYDVILPPLLSNSYRMTVKTDVRLKEGEAPQPLTDKQAFFNIETPRFALPATEVAGVFPPRNGHGPFAESIPHVALYRRTLPWERKLDRDNRIPDPTPGPNDPGPPNGEPPWMALLVFEEGEYTLLQNVPLRDVVPRAVFTQLGSPDTLCDAVETDTSTLRAIIPSKEELQLLTHIRQVSVNDRELSAGDSDGYFAVIMSNRLPSPNTKCRACLVSLEERFDIVPANPPPTASGPVIVVTNPLPFEDEQIGANAPAALNLAVAGTRIGAVKIKDVGINPDLFFERKVRLVLLHSWQFATIGPGKFRDLMQRLDVGMIGKLREPGQPNLTDTAHLTVELQNRVGEQEQVLYRGPLVPFELTRDPLGPYHSADQARRATPETGAEDISYAAAFEVGRLVAAADPRLAQELMRWRREAYKQSSRADGLKIVQTTLQLTEPLDLRTPIAPILATRSVERIAGGVGPIADAFGIDDASSAPGLNPQEVQRAFNLRNTQEAIAILGGDAGALGAVVTAPPPTPRNNTTIDKVAEDTAALNRITQRRDRILENTKTKLGEEQ